MRSSKKSAIYKAKRSYLNQNSDQTLSQFWQIIFFSVLSGVLLFFVIKTGWEPINIESVIIKGNSNFNDQEILKASGVKFPKPFLEVIPKQLELNLIQKLSFKAVGVHRQIFPKKLFIEVLEREPIAFAQRESSKGFENGMVDLNAEWIPIKSGREKYPEISLDIFGWRYNYRELISLILINREKLGSPLKKINFSPTGEISLQTKKIMQIKLGANHNLLIKQINVLSHLSKSLPAHFENKSGTTIDLRDPSKPELQKGKPY